MWKFKSYINRVQKTMHKERKFRKKADFSHSVDNILKLKTRSPNSNKLDKYNKR